jgi:hypothetical protein
MKEDKKKVFIKNFGWPMAALYGDYGEDSGGHIAFRIVPNQRK